MSKQREEFEEWLKLDGYDHHSFEISAFNEENYHNDWVQFAWSAWQQAQKVAVPEGFVVVPREPTKEMYLAGTHELTQIDFRDIYDTDSIQVYKTMIEAGEKK